MNNEDYARELCMAIEPPYIDFIHQNYKTALKAMEWKDKQLADYLQQEWDRCAGACSSIVSAYCRDVERMANDLGIKLKFNNPYIE